MSYHSTEESGGEDIIYQGAYMRSPYLMTSCNHEICCIQASTAFFTCKNRPNASPQRLLGKPKMVSTPENASLFSAPWHEGHVCWPVPLSYPLSSSLFSSYVTPQLLSTGAIPTTTAHRQRNLSKCTSQSLHPHPNRNGANTTTA